MKKRKEGMIGNAVGIVGLIFVCYGFTHMPGTGPSRLTPIEEKATVVLVSAFLGEITVDVYDVNSHYDGIAVPPYDDGNTKLNCVWMKNRWSVLPDLQPGDHIAFKHNPSKPYQVISMRVLE